MECLFCWLLFYYFILLIFFFFFFLHVKTCFFQAQVCIKTKIIIMITIGFSDSKRFTT